MTMTRDEALKQAGDRLYAIEMRAVAERKRHGDGNKESSKLEMEISDLALDLDPSGILGRALSSPCACGGREPIWDGCAHVHTHTGHKAYADAGSIILRGADVKEGQSLEVLIFAPPTEEEGT